MYGNDEWGANRRPPVKEKYFPNGFLQENPDMEIPRKKHRIGILDVLIALVGLGVIGLCTLIFSSSDGLALIRQFFAGDMNLMLDNMNDVRYFSENLDVTWRLYYEIASMAIVTIIMAVVLIILHSFIKNQGIGILKAVVLLVTGIGMLILCIGYFFYNMLTVGAGALLTASASTGMVTVAGIGVIVAAVIWLIYMCIWGFTSFLKVFMWQPWHCWHLALSLHFCSWDFTCLLPIRCAAPVCPRTQCLRLCVHR